MNTYSFSKNLLVLFTLFTCLSCSSDDFLEDLDKQALFAQPTQEELSTIRADWALRDLSPQGYTVEEEIPIGTAGTVLKMVSFRVDGYKQYGALVVPKTDSPVPVRMWLKGFSFNPEKNETSFALSSNDGAFDIPYIFAVPALRGQPLKLVLEGVAYTSPISEGNKCEAFDRATDDAIAFLNIVESTLENANMNKVSIRGGSRGGTVAMLMGIRDERIRRVAGIAGPTNMLELTSKNENDAIYQCQFLEDLVNRFTTIQKARLKMIASSPVFFAEDLPKTQLHMAQNDRIVPLSQGNQLADSIQRLGQNSMFELFVYQGRDHSNIVNQNQELIDRIEAFFGEL